MTTTTNTRTLHDLTVTDAAGMIARGELSPVDYLEALLARIALLGGRIQAWSGLDIDGARAQAQILAAEAKAGKLRGPLHGIPGGFKEEFAVGGMPDHSEPNLPPGPITPDDATAVARMRAAGAIILGKTYMPGASGMPPTRNPWNLQHTAGGTSSGSGAAVGARMVPVALGEQTAGSNLRPAAYCGVSAIKPTFGRASRKGMWAFSYSHDHPGIIGLSMEDLALVLSVISGPDPLDPTTLDVPAPPPTLNPELIRPPRIGVVRNFYPELTEPVMQAAIERAAQKLADAGADVKDAWLPQEFGLAWHTHRLIGAAEGATMHAASDAEELAQGKPLTFGMQGLGSRLIRGLVPATYYLQAQRIRRWLTGTMRDFYRTREVDVLLTATAPSAAPKGLTTTGNAILLLPWSDLGFPAINVQSGSFTDEGLPLGLQFGALPLADEDLLHAGAWIEHTLGRLPAPPLT